MWSFALVAGIELATAWGVIAFVLNYIPFIGPFIATVFPTLFVLVQTAILAGLLCRVCVPELSSSSSWELS